jgi:hypothetical protein
VLAVGVPDRARRATLVQNTEDEVQDAKQEAEREQGEEKRAAAAAGHADDGKSDEEDDDQAAGSSGDVTPEPEEELEAELTRLRAVGGEWPRAWQRFFGRALHMRSLSPRLRSRVDQLVSASLRLQVDAPPAVAFGVHHPLSLAYSLPCALRAFMLSWSVVLKARAGGPVALSGASVDARSRQALESMPPESEKRRLLVNWLRDLDLASAAAHVDRPN